MKKLVIVESPSKGKTIEKYLGKDFQVLSSAGHVRDLSTKGKYGLGIDVENNFKPEYIYIKGKQKIVTSLKKEVKKVDHVYLATDPDREGEAISYHLYDSLGLEENKYDRVVFNEVTKDAVIEAINNPRKIDNDLVNSQETRRFLDRIIGFRLSSLMKSKTSGTSAGRVQSVALKLIVDKEAEIDKFIEEEYFEITAYFNEFEAKLFNYNNSEIKINNQIEADEILSKLSKAFKIESVEKKNKNKKSKTPFITSTLQQDASNKLNMSAKKTMSIAQKLYEGVDIGSETVGLITYMRTDSIRLSSDFIGSTLKYIENNFGKEYVGSVKVNKKSKIQDAHEAIRPTSIKRTPEALKNYLSIDEYKLYSLIYYRALASLMSDAKTLNTTVILENNNYQFKTTGQIVIFDGYMKVYQDYEETVDKILPPLETYQSKVIVSNNIEAEQKFTRPPARYTEAKLIKELEELGIGRPSTYAKIIDNLKTRNYVDIVEKKFIPTEIGKEITEKLQQHFDYLINVKYTANMEEDLDKIAKGDLDMYALLNEFYSKFSDTYTDAYSNMEKKEAERTGEDCPLCNSPLVYRNSRYGKFTACSNYPTCKYVKNEKQVEVICDCPSCDGQIVLKKTKKGKDFYGCNNFPKCKVAFWDRPTGEKCSSCGSLKVTKKEGIVCSSCNQ
jgi:DNA topoisomerase-1